MLLIFFGWLSEYIPAFQVFNYLTLRAILSVLTALSFALFLGPKLIRRLSDLQVGQAIRDDGPKSHLSKSGTPTMGGMLILMSLLTTTLLWGDLDNPYIWLVLAVTFAFATIGWIDDFKKVTKKNSKGLSAKTKYFWQSVFGLLAALYLFFTASVPQDTQLFIPFFKSFSWDMGPLFIVLTYFMVVGFSNAVNLTDGLDGLAILPSVVIACALAIIAYLVGHVEFAAYLNIPHIKGAGELVVICTALVGAGLGFLWFNTYPAQVFMGDVGSLALGAMLALIAVITRHEIVFIIMGGIFVLETVSVILQVASFKLTGKRIFRMAPIHHHFELKGWPEPRVIVRFWIITVILVLIGLATLKLR